MSPYPTVVKVTTEYQRASWKLLILEVSELVSAEAKTISISRYRPMPINIKNVLRLILNPSMFIYCSLLYCLFNQGLMNFGYYSIGAIAKKPREDYPYLLGTCNNSEQTIRFLSLIHRQFGLKNKCGVMNA